MGGVANLGEAPSESTTLPLIFSILPSPGEGGPLTAYPDAAKCCTKNWPVYPVPPVMSTADIVRGCRRRQTLEIERVQSV